MSPSDDGNMLYILNFDKILNKNVTELALINPVVTIKKNKVSLITKEKRYVYNNTIESNDYYIGDIIIYKGTRYIVIKIKKINA